MTELRAESRRKMEGVRTLLDRIIDELVATIYDAATWVAKR
jgi:hypothetical protein